LFVRYNWLMLRRHYIETTDVSGSTEAQVALAESLIDDYVGYQPKWLETIRHGKVTGAVGAVIYDTNTDSHLDVSDNTYDKCVIEIIGGAGVGQRRVLNDSDKSDKSVTFAGSAFNPALDSTSVFKIYQLAKFPRRQDAYVKDDVIYKAIPEAVREACIAQVEFIIEMGADYFEGDDSEMDSERIGNYSYSRGGGSGGQSALVKMIAPRARVLLRGIKNRTGRLLAEDSTHGI